MTGDASEDAGLVALKRTYSRRAVLQRLLVAGGVAGAGLLAACQSAAPAAPAPAPVPPGSGEADTRPFVLLDGQDAVTLDPHSAPDVAYSYNLQRGPAE